MVPTGNTPAAILIVAPPELSNTAPDEYVPLVRVMVPVGVGLPPTVTVTLSVCAVVMLVADAVTVTVGVDFEVAE